MCSVVTRVGLAAEAYVSYLGLLVALQTDAWPMATQGNAHLA